VRFAGKMTAHADLAGRHSDAHYILGHAETERRRLREQASFMNELTHRFLVDAGLRPGMRVLDVGSGFGDVSLLAASWSAPTVT
jgi:2-polyprenyl-3-methyl-5-hydroxy-6-metoxy-1,4-benzoquinol methylase